jgi:hypothetical protein
MPITINGTGTVAGITAGGLPDGCVATADIADAAVINAKLSLAANAGEIKKALNADNPPPIYACRAWVNFNGTRNATNTGASTNGANVFIRASGNVASVLRNQAGDYTITFETPIHDANYATNVSVWNTADGGTTTASGETRGPSGAVIKPTAVPAPGSVSILTMFGSTGNLDGGRQDYSGVYVTIFR